MDIESRVKKVIMDKLGISEEEITEEKDFIKDLKADSLDTVDLVMGLEDEFGIEILEEDREKIKTVGQATNHIKSMIGQSVDQKIKKIISEKSSIDENNININDNLEKDLGIEAIDLATIIDEINRVFEITLPEITISELTTNTLVIEVVKQLMS